MAGRPDFLANAVSTNEAVAPESTRAGAVREKAGTERGMTI